MNNFGEETDELIQYKRLTYKLEDELKQKTSENSLLKKLNDDLKSLVKNVQNECEELNQKLLAQYSEVKNLKKKHQMEINETYSNFDKLKQIYEEKIKQLSGNNPLNQKLMIENEFEMRYEEKLKTKSNEIDLLNNKINYLQRENDNLRTEVDNLKKNNQKQFNLEKERSDKLLNYYKIQKEDENQEKDNNLKAIKDLQELIKNKDERIFALSNELNTLKEDKGINELNIAKQYEEINRKLKEEQLNNYELNKKLANNEEELKTIYQKLKNLQELVDGKESIISNLTNENNGLLQQIENLKAQMNDILGNDADIQKELDDLRELVKKVDYDARKNDETNEKIIKQIKQKNNDKINQLQKELEVEKSKIINFAESNQINQTNQTKDKDIIENEKTKIAQYGDDTNIFKVEYENIKEKYDLLLIEQMSREKKIKKKEEKIEYLDKYLKNMIKKQKQKEINYKELKYKYKNCLEKKEKYKKMCKIVNKNVENIMSFLNQEQRKQIEESDKKYLLDADSFSFTEFY